MSKFLTNFETGTPFFQDSSAARLLRSKSASFRLFLFRWSTSLFLFEQISPLEHFGDPPFPERVKIRRFVKTRRESTRDEDLFEGIVNVCGVNGFFHEFQKYSLSHCPNTSAHASNSPFKNSNSNFGANSHFNQATNLI